MTADQQAAMERYRTLRQWESHNFKPFDGDPYKDSKKVICPMTELLSDDLNTLADAYLAEHTPEREAERKECLGILRSAIMDESSSGVVLIGGEAHRLLAVLEELT